MIRTTVKVLNEANAPPCLGEQSPLAHLMLIPWSPSMAWQLDEWLTEIETHTRRYSKLYAAATAEIVNRLGKDGAIKPDNPNYNQALEELQQKATELGDVEVTLSKACLINLDQLPQSAKLSGYDVRALRKFLLGE